MSVFYKSSNFDATIIGCLTLSGLKVIKRLSDKQTGKTLIRLPLHVELGKVLNLKM